MADNKLVSCARRFLDELGVKPKEFDINLHRDSIEGMPVDGCKTFSPSTTLVVTLALYGT